MNDNLNENKVEIQKERVRKESDDHSVKEKGQPRYFPYQMKEECWNKAAIMLGRNPDRWRLDAVGNPVFKHFRGCSGPLCHEYDHIYPFSKGGKTVLENCQILQTGVNYYKSNKVYVTHDELKQVSPKIRFTEEELDAVEKAAFGTVERTHLGNMVDSKAISPERIRMKEERFRN